MEIILQIFDRKRKSRWILIRQKGSFCLENENGVYRRVGNDASRISY